MDTGTLPGLLGHMEGYNNGLLRKTHKNREYIAEFTIDYDHFE